MPSAVDPIFEALSTCASLHPDHNLSDDEEMDDSNAFINPDEPGAGPFEVFTGDEGQELSEVGRVRSDFMNDARFRPY
jgi:nucleotide-sensitive chloride channel 1A